MKNLFNSKNLHLTSSAIIVIIAGFIYGVSPSTVLFETFGFHVEKLELKNIFRAIMGLYVALGIYWLIGAQKQEYWRDATLSNIVFMGGIAFGRLISTILDGWSVQYGIGMILEALYALWGVYNIKKHF